MAWNIHTPAFSRRRFLRAIGQGALLAALPTPLLAESEDLLTLSILHTTDLHGHILPTVDYQDHPDLGGLARCATQIRRWQKENPHYVLIDIGDVYQGTEVGLASQGATMIRCLNAFHYEMWVIGNHDFDWGLDGLAKNLQLSSMPVLSANARVNGQTVGAMRDPADAFARLKPYWLKEIAGFRLAFVGATTPGLSSWLPPESLQGFEALDPVEALRPILRLVAAEKPDAIILTGHMGLTREDDYANRVGALTREFPQIAVFIGGHTHRNHPGELVNNVLYTQADHFGIYAGKVDLTFDRATRRLVHSQSVTVPMDHQVPFDPLILSVAKNDLAQADLVLNHPMGELTEPFEVATAFGKPSDVERLIASGMIAMLDKRGVKVDAVVHGSFDTKHVQQAGPKIVADAWTLLPYENAIVTIEVNRDDLFALVRDLGSGREFRNIMGMQVVGAPLPGGGFQVTDLRAADGSPLPSKPVYRLALNAYDAQSGGQRFITLARLVATPAHRRVYYDIQTRDALIDFFVARQKVSRASLLV